MQDPQLPPTRERSGAPRRGPDNNAPQAPGMRGFRDIAADADDLGRAAAQATRSARKTYANVPSPSPEFDRLEPSMENRGADPDAPYSYDESVEEAERYAPSAQQPPPQRPQRPRLTQDRDGEPKKRVRTGAVFPFKSAIAVGVVLILVGAGGFAYEEAAEICGCAVGTIKSRVARGRVALENLLTDGKLPSRREHESDGQSALQSIMNEVDELSRDEEPRGG